MDIMNNGQPYFDIFLPLDPPIQYNSYYVVPLKRAEKINRGKNGWEVNNYLNNLLSFRF